MSYSPHNQPVMDDIICAFETTQNQSWSMFNNKLGGSFIKGCKKKDVFRSENPIELLDGDIPVFGLVPRLEKLTLVSCNKCSMVVKSDCIHHHYERRHNSFEDDNFSLERFILSTVKISKHKKQKFTTLQKLPDKEIIDVGDFDPVGQDIKTEFDQLEFERLTGINQAKIKQENEMQYDDDDDDDDESDVNLEIESFNPSTSCGVFDWNLHSLNQNLAPFADNEINDNVTVFDYNSNKSSSDDGEEPHDNTSSNDENISICIDSSKVLTNSLNSNENLVLDFSSIMSDDGVMCDEEPNDDCYQLPPRFVNYIEKPKFTKNSVYSDVTSDSYELSDESVTSTSTTYYQSSISQVSSIESSISQVSSDESSISQVSSYESSISQVSSDESSISQVSSNESSISHVSSDKSSISQVSSDQEETQLSPNNYSDSENDECSSNTDQLTIMPVDIREEIKVTSSNRSSSIINGENSIDTIVDNQIEVNDNPQTNYSELLNNKDRTKCTISSTEYFDKVINKSPIINFCQTSTTLLNIDEENQTPCELINIEEKHPTPCKPISIEEKNQIPCKPINIEEENQIPCGPNNIEEENQTPCQPTNFEEENQTLCEPINIEEEYQPLHIPLNIEEESNAGTNTSHEGSLCNEINDSSKMSHCHIPHRSLNNEEQITFTPRCEYLSPTSNKSSIDSTTDYDQSCITPFKLNEKYQPTDLPNIKNKLEIILNTHYSNLVNEEEKKHESNDRSEIKLYRFPPEILNSETKLFSCDKSKEFINNPYADNVSPSLLFSEETKLSQFYDFTVYIKNESAKESTDIDGNTDESDELSSITSLNPKETKSSSITDYSSYTDHCDYNSDDSAINKYYQLAIGYRDNSELITLSPSFKYSDASSDEIYESAEEYENDFHQLSPKVLNDEDETKSTLSNDNSDDINNIVSDDDAFTDQLSPISLNNIENSQGIQMVLDDSLNNGFVDNIEDEYYQSSPESLNSESLSSEYSNEINNNSSNSSSVIIYDESSASSLDTESKFSSNEICSDSTCDESSNGSVSSSEQSTSLSNSSTTETKYTQTFPCPKHNHKQCFCTWIDKSIVESLSVVNDITKYTQTDLHSFCKDCRRVAADLVEYYYPTNSNVKNDEIFVNSSTFDSFSPQITKNDVNNSIPVKSSTQTTRYPVDSFTPVDSNAQIVNNTIFPTIAEEPELVNSDNCDKHNSDCLLSLRQYNQQLENPNDLSAYDDPIIEQFENIDKMCKYEFCKGMYRVYQQKYRSLMNGSTFIDKNHALCYENVKKNIDEKIVNAQNCIRIPKENAKFESNLKKNLKRCCGRQVADDKENQEKNHRWISGSFKKLKRMEFVNRRISCSDESDNNDNVDGR